MAHCFNLDRPILFYPVGDMFGTVVRGCLLFIAIHLSLAARLQPDAQLQASLQYEAPAFPESYQVELLTLK